MRNFFIFGQSLVLLAMLGIMTGCRAFENPVKQKQNSVETRLRDCETKSGVSAETAKNVAKGYLFLDYELQEREAVVETETELHKQYGEFWKVTLVDKTGTAFGNPIVWVSKRNGEVLTVNHAK